MSNEEYQDLIKKYIKKPNKRKNYLYAFLSGGILGFLCELIFIILKHLTNLKDFTISCTISIIIIGLASLLTAIGIFDRFITKYRSGLIIPTTGFAHSVASSGIDGKKEGLITGIGPSFFSLAGSVILYSIVGSFFLVILKVIINA